MEYKIRRKLCKKKRRLIQVLSTFGLKLLYTKPDWWDFTILAKTPNKQPHQTNNPTLVTGLMLLIDLP